MANSRNLERLLFVALLVIHLVPIWAFPYFVTCDGPAHVDNAAALRNYLQSDEKVLHEYYTLNLRLVPNWITNVALAGLMGFVPPTTAEKLVVSAYVLLLPLSIRYALAGIGEGAVYFSLLSFPIIYNHILHYGFYNFLFSIAVFFFVVGYWLRNHNSLKPHKILSLTGLILVLYFCHGTSLLLLMLTLLILALSLSLHAAPVNFRSVSSLSNGWRVFHNRIWIPVIIGLAPPCYLAARFVSQQGTPPVWPSYNWLFFAWPLYGVTATTNRPENLLISSAVSLLFVVLFFYVIRRESTRGRSSLRNGLLLTILIAAILYAASPYSISGGTVVNPRFALFALLLAILFFGTHKISERVKFSAGSLAAALAIVQIFFNMPVYAQINEDAAEYLSAANVIEPHSTLVSLCFAREECGLRTGPGNLRMTPFSHFSGYISAQRQSVNLFIIDPHTNYFPIRYRDGLDAYPYVEFSEMNDHGVFRRIYGKNIADYTSKTGGRIDYVLLWKVADAERSGEDVSELLRWLNADYDHVFTSATSRLDVYRRKEVSDHGTIGTN